MPRHRTLHLQVMHHLRNDIVFGALQPGQKLQEEELARRYKVSRTPLREAIHQLEREGLLEERPRRGVYVPSVMLDEVVEFFEARELLEHHIILKTCRHIPEDDIKTLRHKIVELQRNCEDYRFVDNYTIIRDFHRILTARCPNRQLSDILLSLILKFEMLYILLAQSKNSVTYYEGLWELLDAMERRNVEAACAATKLTLSLHRRIVIGELRGTGS